MKSTQREFKSRFLHLLIHSDIFNILVVALFKFEGQMDWDANGNLVFFTKSTEMFLLDGRIKVV